MLYFFILFPILVFIILFISNHRFKEHIIKSWHIIITDFLLLILSFAFAYLIFKLDVNHSKAEQIDAFKRNFALAEIEVAYNSNQIKSFCANVTSKNVLPPIMPRLTYGVSENIMADPLILKYSGLTLLHSYLQYKSTIEIVNHYITKLYSVKITDTSSIAYVNILNILSDLPIRQILVFRYLLHFYTVGYNAAILGPVPADKLQIENWINGIDLPTIDSLNSLIQELDKSDSKIHLNLCGQLNNLVK